MRKYMIVGGWGLVALMLVSCSPSRDNSGEGGGTAVAVPTQVASFATATPVRVAAVSVPPTETATPQPTLTPRPSPTPIPPTATPTVQLVAEIQPHCGSVSPLPPESNDILRGFLLRTPHLGENAGLYILGDEGLEHPLTFVPDTESRLILPRPSPNGEWIALDSSNIQGGIWSREITVWNPSTDETITRLFSFDANWFTGEGVHWLNDSQLITTLNHEEELFRWLIWSPFSNTEETLSVELPTIIQQQRLLDSAYPAPDPRLELIVYPCEECGEAEYAVKQFQTGETVWDIDIGPNPSYDYRSYAYWSPNGEIVTVIGGEFLNQLLFFNRDGEKLYEITLPLLDEPGGVMIFNRAWSPDSKHLAFLRVTGATGNAEQILTYVDMADGQVIDLCVNAQTGTPIWSPDSSKIAFSQQIEAFEQPRLISIVDIHSGDVAQLYDADGRGFVGWMDLPRAGE